MRMLKILSFAFSLLALVPGSAFAHFGMVIPSAANVMEAKDSTIGLTLKFWHPFENKGMNLEKPAAFLVYFNGKAEDLLPKLKESKEQGLNIWQSEYTVKRPGVYAFVMEPEPYFEKEEDHFILHLTKTYVSAFGGGEDWDKPLGLKIEIVPLSNPNTLYAGNIFQGKMLQNGEPVSAAKVEIEWFPGEKLQGEAPYENMITQTVKTDDLGVFSFVAPRVGWWGFTALLENDAKLEHDGKAKSLELGATIWVYFHKLLPPKPLPQNNAQK